MENKKSNKRTILIIAYGFISFCSLLVAAVLGGRLLFRKTAEEKLTHAAQLKTLEFQSSLTGELTLVRQMIRSPSIADYLENPDDPIIREMAMKEFGAYQNSFISNSLFWVSDKNLVFYSDMQAAYTVDPDDPDSYWYKMTMYETEEYNFNINYNPDLNVTMLWVNAVVRNKSGTPVGIAGTGIPLTDFISGMYKGLDESIEMYMFNDNLEITGAKDQSILAENLLVTDKMPELKNTDPKAKSIQTYHGRRVSFVLAPMDLVGWHLAMGIDFGIKEFLSNAITPFAVTLVILFIIAAVYIVSSLMANISTLKNAVDNLSSGNADLTQRVVLKNSTFRIIDALGNSVNVFIKKLQDIMVSVKDSNGALVETGNKLKFGTSDTATSITEIIAAIQSMSSNISTQVASVEETAESVNEMSTNIASLDKMIAQQAESVTTASSAITEMMGNIDSVNKSVENLTTSFNTLQEKTIKGVAKQEEVNNMIKDIQVQSQSLSEANQVISSIAEQTNLLAMNAAIEAAHAGEAGKGFSVVADEIRKLSENSSTQSKTIGEQLKNIQDSFSNIVLVSEDSQTVLNEVSSDIGNTYSHIQEINQAMQEQQAGSFQINHSLKELNNSSGEVRSSSLEMQKGNKTILKEIQDLENETTRMKDGMEQMLTGAQKIHRTGSTLSDLSSDMEKAITSISSQLDQFKG
ncbi:MAG: hypothetical protein J5857_07935 [Treponema sp.]|nr:hypothetical protein [Treponema sp.]